MAETLGGGNLKSFADFTQPSGSAYATAFRTSRELLQRSCVQESLSATAAGTMAYWSTPWSLAFSFPSWRREQLCSILEKLSIRNLSTSFASLGLVKGEGMFGIAFKLGAGLRRRLRLAMG